ncbi:MAG: rffA [Bacteroidota bacterium]|jgi:dTDP-4-amino-4,6-dideoxygalactose transaminase|nr:rffA [Bacteroidota bacterium]
MIPFNKPYYSGNELSLISEVMETRILTGDTEPIKRCESLLENKYGFKKVYLTNSCTMALEMAAVILEIKAGDEVIIPAYTYVSTANAFALRGAKLVFADSKKDQPNIDEDQLESLITPHTKVIVVMHYAGISCNMNKILEIAKRHNLFVVEDAAQCIDAYYKNTPLGSIGDIGCFSFHETKNIHCGEGGFISINNPGLIRKTEIVRNKGTNRTDFIKGEVNKYEWMGLGFSAIPSSISAAFLLAQLQKIDEVQEKRRAIWELYYQRFSSSAAGAAFKLPVIPADAKANAHLFFLICNDESERNELIEYLKLNGIQAVFHYQSLEISPYYKSRIPRAENAQRLSECLLRLPLYFDLSVKEAGFIADKVLEFYSERLKKNI